MRGEPVDETTRQAWPFLISTNATSGFVTIVAPQFMMAMGNTDLLRLVTDGEVTPNEAVYVRTIMGERDDAIIVAYRIVPAAGELLHRPDDILYDHQGRRILLIEGAVIPAHPAFMTQLVFTANDFAQVRVAYEAAFRALWEAPVALAIQPSSAFPLDGRTAPLRHLYQPALLLPSLEQTPATSLDTPLPAPDTTQPTLRKS